MTAPKKTKLVRGYASPPRKSGISFVGTPSRTKQSFLKECDINNIMAKYQKTGAITHLQNHQGQYGFASSESFTDSMQIVAKAQSLFNDLPSTIRSKFNQDPGAFLEFVQNSENEAELIEMGLANATSEPPALGDSPSAGTPSDPSPTPPPAEG